MKKHTLTAVVGVGLVAGAIALRPATHVGPPQAYPDPQYTPGIVATMDFKELTTVSACGTYSACHRKTTEAMKDKVCQEYMDTCFDVDYSRTYSLPQPFMTIMATTSSFNKWDFYKAIKKPIEIDHFCPLALGCADDVRNLWAEPEHIVVDGFDYGFHAKDAIELQMVLLMKAQKISPSDAQQCLLNDWVACYRKYMTHTLGGLVPNKDPDDH